MQNLQAKYASEHASAMPEYHLWAQPEATPADTTTISFNSEELVLLEPLGSERLDADKRSGRSQKLTVEKKVRSIFFVRESFDIRQMSLANIQCRARLGRAALSTIHQALAEAGIKAYVEELNLSSIRIIC